MVTGGVFFLLLSTWLNFSSILLNSECDSSEFDIFFQDICLTPMWSSQMKLNDENISWNLQGQRDWKVQSGSAFLSKNSLGTLEYLPTDDGALFGLCHHTNPSPQPSSPPPNEQVRLHHWWTDRVSKVRSHVVDQHVHDKTRTMPPYWHVWYICKAPLQKWNLSSHPSPWSPSSCNSVLYFAL